MNRVAALFGFFFSCFFSSFFLGEGGPPLLTMLDLLCLLDPTGVFLPVLCPEEKSFLFLTSASLGLLAALIPFMRN